MFVFLFMIIGLKSAELAGTSQEQLPVLEQGRVSRALTVEPLMALLPICYSKKLGLPTEI